MADDDGGTVESLDGFLQHILGRHVQMVGGLIENQEVDGFQQQTDHCQSTAFPAAKNLHLLIRSLSTKHKSSKYIIDAQADITLRHIVDGLEDRQRLVEQLSYGSGRNNQSGYYVRLSGYHQTESLP